MEFKGRRAPRDMHVSTTALFPFPTCQQSNGKIGPVMFQFAPFFRMFSDYLANYEKAVNAKTALAEKKEPFGRFLHQEPVLAHDVV